MVKIITVFILFATYIFVNPNPPYFQDNMFGMFVIYSCFLIYFNRVFQQANAFYLVRFQKRIGGLFYLIKKISFYSILYMTAVTMAFFLCILLFDRQTVGGIEMLRFFLLNCLNLVLLSICMYFIRLIYPWWVSILFFMVVISGNFITTLFPWLDIGFISPAFVGFVLPSCVGYIAILLIIPVLFFWTKNKDLKI